MIYKHPLGEKRYIFIFSPETLDRSGWVEKGGKRYPLAELSEEDSWGGSGRGSCALTWRILEDCFQLDNLSLSKLSDVFVQLFPKVQQANKRFFELYEHEIRELL